MSLRKRVVFLLLVMILIIQNISSAFAYNVGQMQNVLLNEIKKGRSNAVFVKTDIPENVAQNLIKTMNNKYFAYWSISPIHYTYDTYQGVWTDGFVVEAKRAKVVYEINQLIEKKAHKIVKKYVKKKMSKKQKCKAIAKGIAKSLSYKIFSDHDVEGSTLRLLRKNKGYCELYSLIFLAACKKVKIPCVIAYGSTHGYKSVNHAWNRVKIGKSWKHVDATWYDCTHYSKYLLAGKLWKSHKMVRIVQNFDAG